MMSVNDARMKIQKTIDDPIIDQVKKRQLFAMYQNLRFVTSLTPEVERLIISLCNK